MFKTIQIIVMATFCLFFSTVKAQIQIDSIKPLRVGDHLPKAFWEVKHQVYEQDKVTQQDLSKYKDRLLILDFWATWCGSCISNFPTLANLQSDFGPELQILLVNCHNTRDTPLKINAFYQQQKALFNGKPLPTIVADHYLLKLFPHRFIPHYVWINPYGVIVAITNSKFLNAEQVKLLIK